MTAARRESARLLIEFGLPITKACDLVSLSRASYYRHPRDWRVADAVVIDVLNAYLFESLTQVREMPWVWMMDYNDERPHEILGDIPLAVYRQKIENSRLERSH